MDRRDFLLGTAALPSLTELTPDPYAGLPPSPPADPDEKYWHELRWHFHIPRGEAYCNTGTLGATPKSAINAVCDHMRYLETQLVASNYEPGKPIFLAGYQDEPHLRERLGTLLGCTKEEIALTQNATVGMNYIAHGLELEAGDQVVMTNMEHQGGRAGYDVRVARDGIAIVEVPLPISASDPDEFVARFADVIDADTKVVAIPHMTSALGYVLPVKRITAMAKERARDCFVVLDGAQAVGQVSIDVRDIGCDAYYGSPHKWLLAPKGSGVLYVNRESERRVWTTIASNAWDFRADIGNRFTHIGTGNQSLYKGFEASLDFLERIGNETIHKRIKQLGDRLRTGLGKIHGVTILSSTHPELCAGITTYSVEGQAHRAVSDELWERDRIMPRAIGMGIRQSLHIYNTFDDVDRTLARVAEIAAR